MSPAVGVALAVVAAGLVTAALARLVVARLPEPSAPDGKLPYRDLVTRRFVTGCALLGGLAAGTAWLSLPAPVRPLWFVLSTVGLLLAAVDARTTWLPLPLTRLSWVLAAAAGATVLLWPDGGRRLLGAALGALAAAAVFYLVWRLSRGGLGFGDVRFAPLVGAAAGAQSWSLAVAGLLLGSLAGLGHGLVRLALRRRGPYPYAPAILAGGYLACVWAVLAG